VRYEIFSAPTEISGRLANFDVSTQPLRLPQTVLFAQRGQHPRKGLLTHVFNSLP